MPRKKNSKKLPKLRSLVTLGMILSRKGGPMRDRADKRKDQKDRFDEIDDDLDDHHDDEDE